MLLILKFISAQIKYIFMKSIVKKIIILVFCLVMSLSTSYSQISNENQPISKDYSESVPYTPTEFPDKDAKKEKKSKANADKNKNSVVSNVDKSLTIPITVVDKQGMVITDLNKSDFQIFVDDRKIDNFTMENKEQSLNIILLLDTSPSTAYKIKDFQDYAAAVVENLEPQDKVLLAEFNYNLKIRTEFTNDRQIINKAINKLKFGDGTSLYDNLQKIFEQQIKGLEGRTALILITDGVDTTSFKSDYEKSLETVEKFNVPIFVAYVETFEQNKKGMPNRNGFSLGITNFSKQPLDKKDYELGKYYLNDLVSLSGGRVSLFENISGSQKGTLPQFAQELRLKYYLKFTPPETDKIGERKQIKVRVNRPNLILLTKGSYIAN